MLKNLRNHLILLGIVCLGLVVRLYKIDTPLADWHSWRQSDTASVTREFVKHNYPIWQPHYQDLSNIPSGLDNLDGYRMVEFPLINYGVAQIIKRFPTADLVVTSRLISIGFSLLSIVSLYGIVFLLSRRALLAHLTSLVFAILPYSVFYSRVILPEPGMIAMQLLSLWLFILWLEKKELPTGISHATILGSALSFSLSLLLKPTAIFIAPVFIVLALAYKGIRSMTNVWLWLFAGISLLPLIAWRQWILHYPAGIPASSWLLNGNGIRLRPAWWRWLFADRLARLILGYWGVTFLSVGALSKISAHHGKRHLFDIVSGVWAVCMVMYLVIFATGNVQHDYYQTLLIPVLSLLIARGIFWIYTTARAVTYPVVAWPLVILISALSLFFGWWEVRGYYNINNPAIVAAGKKVDALTPADAIVIAPYGGDTAFLFQTNRTGWPVGGDIETLKHKGAHYYVSTTFDDEAKKLTEKYTVIEHTPEYILIDLQKSAQ